LPDSLSVVLLEYTDALPPRGVPLAGEPGDGGQHLGGCDGQMALLPGDTLVTSTSFDRVEVKNGRRGRIVFLRFAAEFRPSCGMPLRVGVRALGRTASSALISG
jgi:hypothetical protein